MKQKLLIGISILLLLFSIQTLAVDNGACCEVTKSGDACVFTDVSNCDTSGRIAYTSCEQTSFCEVGCCYSSDEGSCSLNTPRASCEQEPGTSFINSPSCEIAACQKGCCTIGDQAFFVTQTQCKNVGSQFPDANVQFNSGLNTEAACLESARSQEMGCCVTAEGGTFTTRENCNVRPVAEEEPSIPETTTPETTQTFPQNTQPTNTSQPSPATGQATRVGTNNTIGAVEGFYPNMLCSNDRLQTGCAKMHHTDCYDGKVYWYDSCGNRENLYYGDNKDASYNNGFVKEPNSICTFSEGNQECGNCDYFAGYLCGEAPRDINPATGDLTCVSLDCRETDDYEFSPNADGGAKKNGEAWCTYDYQPGAGSDRPGSRHYRHICIAGQEIVEACRDFREELCIQGVITEEAFDTRTALQDSFLQRGDLIQAACRDNRWEQCAVLTTKPDCENQDLYDCYWLEGSITNLTQPRNTTSGSDVQTTPPGVCVPEVPPGLAHWGTEEQPVDLGREEDETPALAESGNPLGDRPENDAVEVCAQATRECTVTYEVGGWENLVRGEGTCVGNCHCEKRDWVLATHDYCQAQGDCGADINIRGKLTLDGFTIENPQNRNDVLLKTEVEKRPDCTNPERCQEPRDYEEPDFFHRLGDSKAWAGLLGIAAGGAVSYAQVDQFTPGLFAGVGGLLKSLIPGGQSFTDSILVYGIETYGLEAGKSYPQQAVIQAIQEDIGQESFQELLRESAASSFDIEPVAGIAEGAFGPQRAVGEAINTAQQAVTEGIAQGTINSDTAIIGTFQQEYTKAALEAGLSGTEITQFTTHPEVLGQLRTQTLQNLNEQATLTVLEEKGFNTAANGQFVPSGTLPSGFANIVGVINILSWGYTVYSLVDVLFTDYETYTITLTCEPWQAPRGGADCETCNEDGRPCSEYKCRSLGQTCRLINQGTSDEKCVNLAPNDVSAPIIKPNPEVLTKGYSIDDEGTRGYEITPRIKPFSPITFGISMNEPAQCKYDTNATVPFEEMSYAFGSSQFLYNQTLAVSLPAELATSEALKITNGGLYNVYVKCQDANGNENERDYLIRFRIDPTPDLTPPIVEATSIANGAAIRARATQTPFSIFLNEPVQACKYSRNDVDFDKMENNFESCTSSGFQTISKFLSAYECSTQLTDITVGANTFYIRCQDNAGNINDESTVFTLRGTEPLEIVRTEPSGELLYGNVTLLVETAIGADNGNAICGYTFEGATFEFAETGEREHTQQLNLSRGNYNIPVICEDSAGNEARDNIVFSITADEEPPVLTKIYSDEQASTLFIETNEPTTCEVSPDPFTFGNGVRMSGEETLDHEALIEGEKLVIICQDIFENSIQFTVYP